MYEVALSSSSDIVDMGTVTLTCSSRPLQFETFKLIVNILYVNDRYQVDIVDKSHVPHQTSPERRYCVFENGGT